MPPCRYCNAEIQWGDPAKNDDGSFNVLDEKSPTKDIKSKDVILHNCPKKPAWQNKKAAPVAKPFQIEIEVRPEGIAVKVTFGADTPEEVGEKIRAGLITLKGLVGELGGNTQ